jgi:hypothetical protein
MESATNNARVGDLLVSLTAGVSPRCEDRVPKTGEWGVLKTSSVRPGLFRPQLAKALPDGASPKKSVEVRSGDVLAIRASGSRRLVGSVCRVEATPARLLMSDYHWRLELDKAIVAPDFFVEAMACRAARTQVEFLTTGSTTAGKISQASLKDVTIPLFDDARDQQRVASALKVVREAADAAHAEADAARLVWRAVASQTLETSHR